jgi:hypothetical protein
MERATGGVAQRVDRRGLTRLAAAVAVGRRGPGQVTLVFA